MIPEWLILSIGFTAQLLFTLRFIVQIISSEKKRKVDVPSAFWLFSFLASFLYFFYGHLRADLSIMIGQSITYFIYIRNLHLRGHWQKISICLRWFFYLAPALIILYYFNNGDFDADRLIHNKDIPNVWLFIGIFGQVLFSSRFIIQWMHSEKGKEVIIPPSFWIISICGALIIISYAIFRKDPVLLAGQTFGLVVYSRNLYLHKVHSWNKKSTP